MDSGPSKLEPEIKKLSLELEHHAEQTSLSLKKLALEAEKLHLDLAKAAIQDKLTEEKLRLDIRELSRSPWLRPGTIIPLLATIGTILFAQAQGVFNIAQQKLELTNTKLQIDSTRLEIGNVKLTEQRQSLDRDIKQLDSDKRELQSTIDGLRQDKRKLEEKVASATLQLDALSRSLVDARLAAKRSDEQAKLAYPSFRSRVLRDITSEIKQECRTPVLPLYVREDATTTIFEIRPRPEKSSALGASISECFDKKIRASVDFKRLKEVDQKDYLKRTYDFAAKLDIPRMQAIHAYSDLNFQPTDPGLRRYRSRPLDGPLITTGRPGAPSTPKLEPQPLPSDEPRRSQWIEWRRKYSVELAYHLHERQLVLATDWADLDGDEERE